MSYHRDFRKSTSTWSTHSQNPEQDAVGGVGKGGPNTATVDGESFVFSGFSRTSFDNDITLGFSPSNSSASPQSSTRSLPNSGKISQIPPTTTTYPLSYIPAHSPRSSTSSSRSSVSTTRSMTPTRDLSAPGSRTVMMPMKGGSKTRVNMRTTSPTVMSTSPGVNGLNKTYNSKQSFDHESRNLTDLYYHTISINPNSVLPPSYIPPTGENQSPRAASNYNSHSQSPSISSLASTVSSTISTTPTLTNRLSHKPMSTNSLSPDRSHDSKSDTLSDTPRQYMMRSKSHDLLRAAHGLANAPISHSSRPTTSLPLTADQNYQHYSHRPTQSTSRLPSTSNNESYNIHNPQSDNSEDDESAGTTPKGSVAFGFAASNRTSLASTLDLHDGTRDRGDDREYRESQIDVIPPQLSLDFDFGDLNLGWDDVDANDKGNNVAQSKIGGGNHPPVKPTGMPRLSAKYDRSLDRRTTLKGNDSANNPSTVSTVLGAFQHSDPLPARSRSHSSGAKSLLDLKLPSMDDDAFSLGSFDQDPLLAIKTTSPPSRIPVPKISDPISNSPPTSQRPSLSFSKDTVSTSQPPVEATRSDSGASIASSFGVRSSTGETAVRDGHGSLNRSRTPSLSSLLSKLTKQDHNGNGNAFDSRSINSSNSSLSPSQSEVNANKSFLSKISNNGINKRRKSISSNISVGDSNGDEGSFKDRNGDRHAGAFSKQNFKSSFKKFTLDPPAPLNIVRPKSPSSGLSLNKSLPPTPTPPIEEDDRDMDRARSGGLKRGLSRMRKKSENLFEGIKTAAANVSSSPQPDPGLNSDNHTMGKRAFLKSSTALGGRAEDSGEKDRQPLKEIKSGAASVVSSVGKAGSKVVRAVRKNSVGFDRSIRHTQSQLQTTSESEGVRSPSIISAPSDASDHARNSFDDEAAVVVATRVNRVASPDLTASIATIRQTASPILIQRERVKTADSNRTSRSGSVGSPPTVGRRKRDRTGESGLGSDGTMSSTWLELEEGLTNFMMQSSHDRGSIVSNTVLPFIKKEELRLGHRPDHRLVKRQREILFAWLDLLHQELQQVQPTHRGSCLEAAAGILESRYFSPAAMEDDELGETRIKTTIVKLIAFAIEKLNDKAVYANTLVFAGRLFALAFFRIEGLALKLLRSLPPVKRGSLRRMLAEAGLDETDMPPVEPELFPRHLWKLCYRNFNTYFDTFNVNRNNPDPEDDGLLIRHEDIAVEMNGNWLLRWTASDSDLPFAFLRAYHRQLAKYLYPDDVFSDSMVVEHPSEYIGAPGFLFLASSLMDKVDALIRRNLRSVTSISPSNNINATESATLAMGQKPKVLELANRRLVSTILDIIGGQPTNEDTTEEERNTDPRNHHRVFGGMLKVLIKAVVKRTSLWDTRGVFLLLDWIEGLLYTVCFVPLPKSTDPPPPQVPVADSVDLFDINFILSFIKTILLEADNTVCIMRTIAFLYAHFEILTLRKQDREELCENMLLDRTLFQRLFLSFNVGVRGYFQRLMVWRLSRIGVPVGDNIQQQRDPQVLKIFAIFNMRLEAIRRRHDEIDPLPDFPEGDDNLFRPKRSTICSTRGVKEVDWVIDELEIPDVEVTVDEDQLPPAPLDLIPIQPKKGKEKKAVNMAAVVSWLKILTPRKGNTKRGDDPNVTIDPFTLDGPPSYQESSSRIADEVKLDSLPPTTLSRSVALSSSPSTRSIRSGSPDIPIPPSPTFFSFEFEVDTPRSDNFEPSSNYTPFPPMGSSSRRQSDIPKASSPNHPISPRVSLRFSKRVSILPPPALNILTEGGPVPPIPDAFKYEEGYEKRLHQYAIRSLREYEEALDEFDMHTLWRAEEESNGKKNFDSVPRLAVSWPHVFDES